MGNPEKGSEPPPHVLVVPLPMQGHVNSMLKLSELLCLSNFHVTMLLSDYTYARILRYANIQSLFSRYGGFRFATISDGLPDEHPRVGEKALDIVMSLGVVGASHFRDLMESTNGLSDEAGGRRPVGCVIADGVLSFAATVAEDMGIPYIYFRTISACSFWAYFCVQDVIDAGEVPFKAKGEDKLTYWKREDMDLVVSSIPGMERLIRRRDLPSFFRVNNVNDPVMQIIKTETIKTTKARALILNTFEDLEGPVLDQIHKHIPNLYSIGPLHAHLKARLLANTTESLRHSGSFWSEDWTSMEWLDLQPAKSVIYVSFGSLATVTRDELLEFWYGLVNSGQRFLWVMRPDSIVGSDGESQIPEELQEGTKARGYMVDWVPQEEVLAHPATGGFLTHSGWNSTLECLVAGVPMICWPYFADQMINSRFVSEVWKVGLDLKDTCNRVIIEKAIRDLMDARKDWFLERADQMAKLTRKAVSESGSSHCSFDGLIQFLWTTAV